MAKEPPDRLSETKAAYRTQGIDGGQTELSKLMSEQHVPVMTEQMLGKAPFWPDDLEPEEFIALMHRGRQRRRP